jgi:Putative adhesin
MSRSLAPIALSIAAAALSLGPAIEARAEHGRGHSISIDDGVSAPGCAGVHVTFGGLETARAEETLTIPRAQARDLVLSGARRGGVTVTGTGASAFTITACKVAAGESDAEAAALLPKIALKNAGGRISVEGPDEGSWTGFLVVSAPRDADFSIEATNGPVSASNLAGAISIRIANGPVTLNGLSGALNVDAVNGPVTLKQASGDVRIKTSNGPVSVTLSGTRWEGKGLDADAKNGPLTLRLPDDYTSSVRVETSTHSPLSCRAAACARAHREDGDRTRLIEIGGSDAVVRLSSVNGPVSIVSAAPRS